MDEMNKVVYKVVRVGSVGLYSAFMQDWIDPEIGSPELIDRPQLCLKYGKNIVTFPLANSLLFAFEDINSAKTWGFPIGRISDFEIWKAVTSQIIIPDRKVRLFPTFIGEIKNKFSSVWESFYLGKPYVEGDYLPDLPVGTVLCPNMMLVEKVKFPEGHPWFK